MEKPVLAHHIVISFLKPYIKGLPAINM